MVRPIGREHLTCRSCGWKHVTAGGSDAVCKSTDIVTHRLECGRRYFGGIGLPRAFAPLATVYAQLFSPEVQPEERSLAMQAAHRMMNPSQIRFTSAAISQLKNPYTIGKTATGKSCSRTFPGAGGRAANMKLASQKFNEISMLSANRHRSKSAPQKSLKQE